MPDTETTIRAGSSVAERDASNVDVAGSIPAQRSTAAATAQPDEHPGERRGRFAGRLGNLIADVRLEASSL